MPVPRKRFGQHFLCDQAIIQRIIAAIAVKLEDHIIEIGPGQGAMTIPLLQQLKHLEVIELDRDMVQELQKRVKNSDRLTIYSTDVLAVDFANLKKDARPLRIVGNLPYNISTPLIFHLLQFAPIIADMVFMLQKEVAARLAAKADTADYGRLSVMVQYHCRVELLFDVPAHAFYPPPQVRSSIVRLIPLSAADCCQANDYNLFALIVKQAFNQRRKTLRNSLKDLVSDEIWLQLAISSDLRPENLNVADFVAISNAC